MQDRPSKDLAESIFEEDWEEGLEYDLEVAKRLFLPELLKLKSENKLGPVVADVGCGPLGISSVLPIEGLKIIRTDLVASKRQTADQFQFPLDLRKLESLSFRSKRNLVEAQQWLGTEGEPDSKSPVVDTIIVSSVLNYLDYKKVLKQLLSYLKPQGRLAIFNAPHRGKFTHGFLFSENGPKDNREVIEYLNTLGLDSETLKLDGINIGSIEKLDKLPQDRDLMKMLTTGNLTFIGKKNV